MEKKSFKEKIQYFDNSITSPTMRIHGLKKQDEAIDPNKTSDKEIIITECPGPVKRRHLKGCNKPKYRESGYESPLSNRSSVVETSKEEIEHGRKQIQNVELDQTDEQRFVSADCASLKTQEIMDNLVRNDEKKSFEEFLQSLKPEELIPTRRRLEGILAAFLREDGLSKSFFVTLTFQSNRQSVVSNHMFIIIHEDRDFTPKRHHDWLSYQYKHDINMESRAILAQGSGKCSLNEMKQIDEFNKTYFQSKDVKDLLLNHTNLNSISITKGKSIRFGTRNWILTDDICVVLHCFHKGFIPYGESSFPKKIGNFLTDVREGYCSFSTKVDVQMGNAVYTESNQMQSSVGNFVGTNTGTTAFITCAHAMLPLSRLAENKSVNDFIGIEFFKYITREPIGKVVDVAFKCNAPGSVDAVVVELNEKVEDISGFPNIRIDPSHLAGFSLQPYHISSETLEITNYNRGWTVVKYGATTQLTCGQIQPGAIHPKMDFNEGVNNSEIPTGSIKLISMNDQILINPIGQMNFLEQGDSGSFVFMVDEQSKKLKIIGMLIGQTTCGQGIMTPIKRILEEFNLTGLKQYVKPISIQAGHQSQEMMQSFLMSLDIKLNNIIHELGNLRADVDELKKNRGQKTWIYHESCRVSFYILNISRKLDFLTFFVFEL